MEGHLQHPGFTPYHETVSSVYKNVSQYQNIVHFTNTKTHTKKKLSETVPSNINCSSSLGMELIASISLAHAKPSSRSTAHGRHFPSTCVALLSILRPANYKTNKQTKTSAYPLYT